MGLIATWDLRVLSKRIGEIVNYYINDLEIKADTLKGDMFMNSSEKADMRLVCKAVEALFKDLL